MKFLYALLTIIWLSFGWACIEAMQWGPPRPAPYQYAREIQRYSTETIEQDIKELKLVLASDNLPLTDRSRKHYQLSFRYMLKAFNQNNFKSQQVFFDKALEHALEALKPFPDDWPTFWVRAAEVYAMKDNWDKADEYYEKALRIAIEKQPDIVNYVVASQQSVRGSRPPS